MLGVVDLAIHRSGPVELGVVEGIERLCAELKRLALGQMHILSDRQIEVFDTRSMKDATLGVAQSSAGFYRKQRSVECRFATAAVGIGLERPRKILRRVEQIIIDAVAQRAEQRVIRIVSQRYRKAGGEARCARDAPIVS